MRPIVRFWLTQGDAQGSEEHFIEALRIMPGSEDARVGLVESLKMRNPVMRTLMRGMLWLERLPMAWLLGGVLVLSVLGRVTSKMDSPALAFLGDSLRVILMAFFMISLVFTPLFNLILARSKRGRLAFSEDEIGALKWAVIPLLLGLHFSATWVLQGVHGLPSHAVAWFAVAALVNEVIESRKQEVRRKMRFVAGGACGLALGVLVASYVYMAPQLREVILELAGLPDESGELSNAARGALVESLSGLLRLNKWLVVYPALALWVLATFRENVREYFEQHAQDEE